MVRVPSKGSAFKFTNDFSLLFDGVDERVDCGNDTSLDFDQTDAISVSFWMRKNGTPGDVEWVIAKKDDAGATNIGWGVVFVTSENQIRFIFDGGSVASRAYIKGSTNLCDDNWHHVVCAKGTGTGVSDMEIYVDGNIERFFKCIASGF